MKELLKLGKLFLVILVIAVGAVLIKNPQIFRSRANDVSSVFVLPQNPTSPQVKLLLHFVPNSVTFYGFVGATTNASIPNYDTNVHACLYSSDSLTWDQVDQSLHGANVPQYDTFCSGCDRNGAHCHCTGSGALNFDHAQREINVYHSIAVQCRSQQCQQHLANPDWSDIDTTLHAANYPGPYDHGLRETQAYERTATYCRVAGPEGHTQFTFNVCGSNLGWGDIDKEVVKRDNNYIPHHDLEEIINYEKYVCNYVFGPASNPNSFPSSFRVSNSLDTINFSTEQTFYNNNLQVDWQLTPDDGQKTVYVEFKVNGIWSDPLTATTTLTTPSSTPQASSSSSGGTTVIINQQTTVQPSPSFAPLPSTTSSFPTGVPGTTQSVHNGTVNNTSGFSNETEVTGQSGNNVGSLSLPSTPQVITPPVVPFSSQGNLPLNYAQTSPAPTSSIPLVTGMLSAINQLSDSMTGGNKSSTTAPDNDLANSNLNLPTTPQVLTPPAGPLASQGNLPLSYTPTQSSTTTIPVVSGVLAAVSQLNNSILSSFGHLFGK